MIRVTSETVRRTKNTIKGHFTLSDKSKTKFDIDRGYGWNQWGNTTDNLSLTVNRVEELLEELRDI